MFIAVGLVLPLLPSVVIGIFTQFLDTDKSTLAYRLSSSKL